MNFPPPPPPPPPPRPAFVLPRWHVGIGLSMLEYCLAVCNFSQIQVYAVQREGYNTLDDIAFARIKDIRDIAKSAARPPANVAGGAVHIGAVQIRNLEALWHWCFRQKSYGFALNAADFGPGELGIMLNELQTEEANDAADKNAEAVKGPGKFKSTIQGWIEWEMSLENYLRSLPSKQKVPLAYVIRKDNMPPRPDPEVIRMYMVQLAGSLYNVDNKQVFRIIKDLTLGTDGWEWIKVYDTMEDGRGAMLALRAHYDGSAAISRRIAYANQIIKDAHYRAEHSYPFEQFVTKLTGAFQILSDSQQPKTEKQKIDDLVQSIHSTHPAVQTMIQYIRMSEEYSNNFTLAANKMSEAIACAFPGANVTNRRVSHTSSSSVNGRTGTRGGRQGRGGRTNSRGGRSGRGNSGRSSGRGRNNRTDNTSTTSSYISNEAWFTLTPQQRQTIIAARRANNPQGGENNRSSSAVTVVEGEATDVSTITQATATAGAIASSPSNAFGRNSHRNTSAIVSSARAIKSINFKDPVVYPDFVANLELDSHADTHCFGKNFTPILWTTDICNVSGFSTTLPVIEAASICTACTAYDDPITGATIILEFPQGIWMGEYLDHSLINPNQCRAYNVKVFDDPFDTERPFGFSHPDHDTIIPFELNGPNVVLKTRAPSVEEINKSSYRLIMSSDRVWNPDELHTLLPLSRSRSFGISSAIQCTRDEDSMADILESKRIISHERAISLASSDRHTAVSAENLAANWGIGLETARKTLRVTTQYGVRHALHPLRRRYKTDILLNRYRRLNTTMYSDTMFFKYKSLHGFTSAQVFCNNDIVQVYPMPSKAHAGEALQEFISDVGIPSVIVVDGAQEQVGPKSEFAKTMRKHHIDYKQTEAYTPRQNRAEYYIGELKRTWRQFVSERKISPRLWNYGVRHFAEIMCRTAKGDDERTGIERITGDTPDISEYLDFRFYDLVWYWDAPWSKEDDKKASLGRWLGVSHKIGSSMCYYVLNEKGNVLSRTTVQHVTKTELESFDVKSQVEKLDADIQVAMKDANNVITRMDPTIQSYVEDIALHDDITLSEDNIPEADIHPTPDSFDTYLNAEVHLPYQGEWRRGTVVKRAKGDDGTPIGTYHQNPILDTRRYVVEFLDGVQQEYMANIIAENIYSQCDTEGRQHLFFNQIVDHRILEDAIKDDDAYIVSSSGNQVPRRTTKGWDILIEWRDGSTSWLPLKQVKDSNPIELAEYAAAKQLLDAPVFKWWAKWVLNKRDRLIGKVKSKYWRTTHKFGIRIPKTVEEALQIDKETGTNFWFLAILKEMTNVKPAMRITDFTLEQIKAGKVLVGYQMIRCHMIFDVKIEGLVRKARFVAGGHLTDAPESITFSSVVSRDSVRIAFLYAALNDLLLWAADVTNAYLNAKARERIYFIAGPEFGSDTGKVVVIEMALYGLKSSGAAWRNHLATSLIELGYKNTIADPDVWIRNAINPVTNIEYYEMVLVYVDDILYVGHDPKKAMDDLGKLYRLKEGSVGPPTRYLGANINKYSLPDGSEAWSMSARDYLNTVIRNVEQVLATTNEKLKSNVKTPLPSNYKPELDVSELLEPAEMNYYQQLIGILRWTCELGRVDILLEVSLMSSYNANPRVGHMEAVYHIFAYLKGHVNSSIVFDSKIPSYDPSAFQVDHDWHEFYAGAEDVKPPNMPAPKGKSVVITCFVDANHAGNLVTRRSQTGFIIFINKAPIIWYSKRQNTVESSTFGSEFNALRIACEQIEALRYKLRMFGIEIDGPANVFCDNQAVVNNCSLPQSTLNKKHNAICYHKVRELVAAGIIRVGKVNGSVNMADLFTKLLASPRRRELLAYITY